MTNPTCRKVFFVRQKARSTQRRSMIRAFAPQVIRMNVDVLHCKPKRELLFKLTAVGKGAQAVRACEYGLCPSKHRQHAWNRKKTQEHASRATGHGAQVKRALRQWQKFSGIMGMDPGTCECEMCFGCDNRAKHDIDSSTEKTVRKLPIQLRCRHRQGEYSRQCTQPNYENHCLFRALWSEWWEYADTLLWQDGGPREDVSRNKNVWYACRMPE